MEAERSAENAGPSCYETTGIEKEEAGNPLEEVLAYHEGDALPAVQILEDYRPLRHELVFAEGVMRAGMTRGWRWTAKAPTDGELVLLPKREEAGSPAELVTGRHGSMLPRSFSD